MSNMRDSREEESRVAKSTNEGERCGLNCQRQMTETYCARSSEIQLLGQPQTVFRIFSRDHYHPPRMSKKQIYYSDKYNDEEFEYRYKQLF